MAIKFEKVVKEIQIYPEAFKRKVIEEYLSGTCTKMDLLRKYQIRTKSGIQRWMKSLGYIDGSAEVLRRSKFTSTSYNCMPSKLSKSNSNPLMLQKRIAELERQLQDERLRSEAFQRMLENAEKELHIQIRKKPYTR